MGADKCKVVCDYRKRKRRFTPADAGRIICDVMSQGFTWNKIVSEAKSKCRLVETDCDCEKLRQLVIQYERIFTVAMALVALVLPLLAAVRVALPILLRVVQARRIKQLQKAPEVERILIDGKRTLEGEFRVISQEAAQALKQGATVTIK